MSVSRRSSPASGSGCRSDKVSTPARAVSKIDLIDQQTGMSKAVRLPIEVVAQRTEEVIEISDGVSQLVEVDNRARQIGQPCCALSRQPAW